MVAGKRLIVLSVCAALAAALIVAGLFYVSYVRKARHVAALMEQMRGITPSMRENAARELAVLGGTSLVPYLIRELANTDNREPLIGVFVDIGEPAVGPLVAAMGKRQDFYVRVGLKSEDRSPEIREGAAQALVAIGEPAVDAVVAALDNTRDPGDIRRTLAAQVLGEIASPRAVDALSRALDDRSDDVRRSAARALSMIKTKEATDALAGRVDDRDEAIRKEALDALKRTRGGDKADKLAVALKDPDIAIRTNAALELAGLKDPRAVDVLVAALKFGSDKERAAVAEALGSIKDARAVKPLIAMANDREDGARWAAIVALGQIGDKRAVQTLIDAFNDPREDIRKSAAYACEEFHDLRLLPILRDKLANDNVPVRKSSMWALYHWGGDYAVEGVLAGIKDEDLGIRKEAVDCVDSEMPRDERLFQAVINAAGDAESEVRANAVIVLGNLKDKRAQPALVKALRDRVHGVRTNAAVALCPAADETAIPALAALAADGSVEERAYGIVALGAIGSKEAFDVIDSLLGGKPDTASVAASYRDCIAQGSEADLPILAAALVKHGDLKMAEDYFWSDNLVLKCCASWWTMRKGTIRELNASADAPERPKWRRKSPMASLVKKLLAELDDKNPETRRRAAVRLGTRLSEYAPRKGASVFDERKTVVVAPITDPTKQSPQMQGFPYGGGSMDDGARQLDALIKSDLRESLTHDDILAIMDRLAAMLSDPEPKVRAASARALAQSGDASVIDRLTALASDPDANVRYVGVYSLGYIADPKALDTLRKFATSPDAYLREAVIMAFANHNPASGADLIIKAVEDSSPSVRESAVEALLLVPDARVPDVLARLLRGKDISLRVAAAVSLDELASGAVFGVVRTSQLSSNVSESARKILKSAAAGYDIDTLAADYGPAIAAGNEKMLAVLILCLALKGTPEMAADFYWSGNADLREAALAFSKSDSKIKPEETTDTPERPKWPGSPPPAK